MTTDVRSWFHAMRVAAGNIRARMRRNSGWVATVLSLTVLLFLTHVLFVVLLGATSGLRLFRQQTDIRLEVTSTVTDEAVQDLMEAIRAQPTVEDVTYITREQALSRERERDPDLVRFLTTYGIANPFPDTVVVRLKNLEHYQELRTFLHQPSIAAVVNPAFLSQTTNQEQEIVRLLDIVRTGQALTIMGGALSSVALLLLVLLTVRHHALLRREECSIASLLGAGRRQTVLTPALESFVLLLVSFIVSLLFAAIIGALLIAASPSVVQSIAMTAWPRELRPLLTVWVPVYAVDELLTLAAIALTFGVPWHLPHPLRFPFRSR